MKKPLIGITSSHDTTNDDLTIRPTYLRALKACHAIPVILPLDCSKDDLKQLVLTLDGFLFTGGPDVHPFLFGEETHEKCQNVSALRDQMELSLLPLVMEQKKPVLGICRGLQVLNIGLGGTIYQDITSTIAHKQPFAYQMPSHHVQVSRNSLLYSIVKEEVLEVNSCHHQAVKQLAPGFMASGYSPDGFVEAAEFVDYPFLVGVQWHPEYLFERDPKAFALFDEFVKACSDGRLRE